MQARQDGGIDREPQLISFNGPGAVGEVNTPKYRFFGFRPQVFSDDNVIVGHEVIEDLLPDLWVRLDADELRREPVDVEARERLRLR